MCEMYVGQLWWHFPHLLIVSNRLTLLVAYVTFFLQYYSFLHSTWSLRIFLFKKMGNKKWSWQKIETSLTQYGHVLKEILNSRFYTAYCDSAV